MDAGVQPIDIETKKIKEEMKLKEAQARAVVEHGELALISVEGPQTATQERIAFRPPMLQVPNSLIFVDDCMDRKYKVDFPLASSEALLVSISFAANILTDIRFLRS